MRRYWDLTNAERAALTEDQVEKLLAYELMERGVLMPEPLVLEKPQDVAVPTRRVFSLCEKSQYGGAPDNLNIACDTVEEAEAARAALRYVRTHDWQQPVTVRPVRDIQIIAEDLPDTVSVAERKAALEEKKRIEAANAEATKRYEEAHTKVAEATASLREDWHSCRRAEARYQKIRDTLAEYMNMTGGDEAMARAFLAKAPFPADEIDEAIGPAPTTPDLSQAAEAA